MVFWDLSNVNSCLSFRKFDLHCAMLGTLTASLFTFKKRMAPICVQ